MSFNRERQEIFMLAAITLVASSLLGCSKSKEDVALERFANRKPPAYVRFANYGATAITPAIGGDKKPELQPGNVSPFYIRPSTKQKTEIQADGKSIYNDSIAADPNSGVTLAVTPKGVKLYTQASRMATKPQAALHTLVVNGDSPVSVMLDNQPFQEKVAPETLSDLASVSAGNHKVTVKTSDGKTVDVDQDCSEGDAFTIFVSVEKSGPTVKILKDTPNMIPVKMGGLAGGG